MTEEERNRIWPFYFKVTIENVGEIICKEISMLDTGNESIEYQNGSNIKTSQLKLNSNVILKNGASVNNSIISEWYANNNIQHRNITISLLDEEKKPIKIWNLVDAWLVKTSGVSLKSNENEIRFERLEIAHSGLTTENA